MTKPESAVYSREKSIRASPRSRAHTDQTGAFLDTSLPTSNTTPASQKKHLNSPPSWPLATEAANARPESATPDQHFQSLPRTSTTRDPRERSFLHTGGVRSGSQEKHHTCTTEPRNHSTPRGSFPATGTPRHHPGPWEQAIDLPPSGSWPRPAPSAANAMPRVPRQARRISFRAPSSDLAVATPAQHPSRAPPTDLPRQHGVSTAQPAGHSTPQGPSSKSQDPRHSAGVEHDVKLSPAFGRSATEGSEKAGIKRRSNTISGAEGSRAGKQSRGSSPERPYVAAQSKAAVLIEGPSEAVPEGAAVYAGKELRNARTEGQATEQTPRSREISQGFGHDGKAPGEAPALTPSPPALEAHPLRSHGKPPMTAHLQNLRAALERSRIRALEKKVLAEQAGGVENGLRASEQPAQTKGEDRSALLALVAQPHSSQQKPAQERGSSRSGSHERQRGIENRPVVETTQSPQRRSAEGARRGHAEDGKSSIPGEVIQRRCERERRDRDHEMVGDRRFSVQRRECRHESEVRRSRHDERSSGSSRRYEERYRSRSDEAGYRRRHNNEVHRTYDEERYGSRRVDSERVDREHIDRREDNRYGSSMRTEEKCSSRGPSEERKGGGAEGNGQRPPAQEQNREKAGPCAQDIAQAVAAAAATAAKLASAHKAVAALPAVLDARAEAGGAVEELHQPPWASTEKAGSSKSLTSIRAAAAKTAVILKSVKLPNFVKLLAGGPIDPEVQALNARLKEVNAMLLSGSMGCSASVTGEVEPPSPPPVYNSAGVRINTREKRAREALRRERLEIIAELLKKDPTYKAPADYRPPKLYRKIPVPVSEFPNFNFVGFILGPRGSNQQRMERESGAKIFLRGREMQRSAPAGKVPWDFTGVDSSNDEPLHVLIEATTEASLEAAASLVQKQLATSPEELHKLRNAQLRELAVINGTQKKSDACFRCGNPSHHQNNCPQSDPSFQADVKCLSCGDGSHPTSDCPMSRRAGAAGCAEQVNALGDAQENFEYKSFLEEIGAEQLGLGAYFHAMGEAGKGQSLFSESGAIQSSIGGGDTADAEGAAGGPGDSACTTASAAAAVNVTAKADGGEAASSTGVAPAPPAVTAAVTGVASLPAGATAATAAASASQQTISTGASIGVPGGMQATSIPRECRLYVGNLPCSMTNYQFKELFRPFGELVEATVKRDHATGESRGFGFVHYKSREVASKAAKAMDNYCIDSRFLRVRCRDEFDGIRQQQGLPGGQTGTGAFWGAENGVPTEYPRVSAPAYQQYQGHASAYALDPPAELYHYAEGDPAATASYQASSAYAPSGYEMNAMSYQPALEEYGNPVVYLDYERRGEEGEFPPGLEPDQESEGPPGVDKEVAEGPTCGAPEGYPSGVAGNASIYWGHAGANGGQWEYEGYTMGPYMQGTGTLGTATLTAPPSALPSLVASPPAGDEPPPGEDPSHWMAAEATAAEAALAPPPPPLEPSAELPTIAYTDPMPAADNVSGPDCTPCEPCKKGCVATAESGSVIEEEDGMDYIIEGELPPGVLPGYPGLHGVQAQP